MKLISIFSVIIFLFVSVSTTAQIFLPKRVISKYNDGRIYLRWEPSGSLEWRSGIKTGYSIKVRDISKMSVKDNTIEALVKPLPLTEWDEVIGKQTEFKTPFYEGCKKFIYSLIDSGDENSLETMMQGESEGSIDSFRLGMVIYSATYDFKLAKYTGLAFDFSAKQGHEYEVEISCIGYPSIKEKIFASIENEEVPELTAEWGDKEVELKWNTLPYTKKFMGYMIGRSEDGLHFVLRDSIPIYNNLEKYAKKGSTESFVTNKEKLDENYKTYYFRVRGFDYFGQIGNRFSSVIGYGYDKLTLSPALIFADQTIDNKAHLKWKIPPSQERLIKDFSVLRADSVDGKYELELDSISRYSREVKFPITHSVNYYRILANPKDGKSLSSMPILVMGQDSIPPEKPEIISATIDSLGRVEVKWRANQETDLWGYRIYKSNFATDEFSLLNSYPVLDTVFIDSIDIDLGNEDVFYMLNAADKRNNRSPFSDTIQLEVPDVIPPSMPLVYRLEQIEDTVVVYFNRSMSDDVVSHTIFKRDINVEGKAWLKFAQFDSTFFEDKLKDVDVKANHHYAYTIVAKDDSGLESEVKYFEDIIVKEIEKEFIPFKSITHKINEEDNTVTIRWECNEPERLKTVMVYRGNDKTRLSRYKYVDAPSMELTDKLKKGKEVIYYRLKPVFKNQKKSYISDFIQVENPLVKKPR